MKEVSELIFQTLTQNISFSNEMGVRCYPLFAKEGVQYPFTVYNIGETPPLTSEARNFPITVSLCYSPENYLEAIVFSDVVKEIFEELPDCEFQSTVPSFDEENQTIMININLLIIK